MSTVRKHFALKTIALILILTLLVQQFQTLSFASSADPSEYIPLLSDSTEFLPDNLEKPAEDAYILFEDESKRELSSKQFRMSDGTFMAVSYPEQVHFVRPDGTFADIDNRLIYSKSNSENDYSGYINRANFFTVKFNETFDTGSSIIYSVTRADSSIVFSSLNDEHNSKSANATVTQAKDEEKPFLTTGDAAGELAFVTSKISYSDTDNKINHDYVLIGNHINEYIVIKEKLSNYTFTYRIDAENLTAETDDDGGIVFTDGSGEIVYSIPAPYMYDDSGIFSNAVAYTLTETDGAYILTVQADENWINEEDRAFPVTIDPDLYVGKYNSSDVEDADVWQGSPTLIQGDYEYMICGYTDYIDNKDMRMLVKIGTLPPLPAAAVLVDARLNMKQLTRFSDPSRIVFGGSTPIDFAARRITSDWSESTVTWNTKPSVNSTILDYRTASLNTKGKYLAFDITEAAVMWYNG
ncbi:MAG: DNRLRE domain-containing protein, partial [Clostridia bacterium]|nr:DNRLRE domain-containing protein [Clostridia bacterium]